MMYTNVSIVQYLISTRFALMASDEEAQFVLLQEVGSHVWTEVCSCTAESIRHTTTGALRVWPEDVKYL